MRLRTSALALLTATLVTTATGGCSSVDQAVSKEKVTMTPAQARQKIDKILGETCAAVTPTLHWVDDWPSVSDNFDALTGKTDGTAKAGNERYITTRISTAKRRVLFKMIADHWRSKGYAVATADVAGNPVSVRGTASDGTVVDVLAGSGGNVSLSVTVGTIADPDPARANLLFGTPPKTQVDQQPRIDDPFWSH